MKIYNFRLNIKETFEGSLSIIIPTPSIKSPNFKTVISSLSRSTLPRNHKIIAVESSGPEFNFAHSINEGFKLVEDEDILLLNDDCILRPETVLNTLKGNNDKDGVLGARIFYPNGRVQHLGGKVEKNAMRILLRDTLNFAPFFALRSIRKAKSLGTRYVRTYHYTKIYRGDPDYVMGSYFFIKNNAFKAIGRMDENFKNGFEDLDYCIRAKQKGFRVRVPPEIVITHKEHDSLRFEEETFFDNLVYFNKKYNSR